MGKIYNYSEIEQGRIPRQRDFLTAKAEVRYNLSRLSAEGETYGAKIFGSVAKGTPRIRSDLDLLIIINKEDATDYLKMMFDDIHRETNVEIDPIVIAKPFAERGMHSIDVLFLRHIASIPDEGNVMGNNPLGILRPFNLSPAKVHEQYLAQKIRRLREGIFTYSETDRTRVLQRALEAPVNVGRRTLQTLSDLGLRNETSENDSKATVIRTFRDSFRNIPSLTDGFNTLLDKDRAYLSLLSEAMLGLGQEEYNLAVSSLARESIPQAIAWTSELSMFYASILEGNKKTQEGTMFRSGKER